MRLFHFAIVSASFVTIGAVNQADPVPMIHDAPAENLEHIDVELIDSGRSQ